MVAPNDTPDGPQGPGDADAGVRLETAGSPRPPARSSSLLRIALLSLPVHVVLRGGEAVLPLLLGSWFGRSPGTDALYRLWAGFQLVGSLVFAAYHDSAIVPVLTRARRETPEAVPALLGSLLAHTIVFAVGLACLSAAAWTALPADAAAWPVVLAMLLPFALFIPVTGTRSFFIACLQSEHHFFSSPTASALGMATNLSTIFFLRQRYGVVIVPYALLLGELVTTAALVFDFARRGGTLAWSLARPPAFWRFLALAGSEVVGGTITRINPVVDQFMAGLAGVAGGGTLLRYSIDVALVPTSLLQAALFPVLLSRASTEFADGRIDDFRRTVRRTLVTVLGLLVAVALLMAAASLPLMKLAFLHGEMDLEGVRRMAGLMPYHLAGLASFGALLTLARAHSAMGNSRFFWVLGVLNATLNVLLDAILVRVMGLAGIALATSLVHTVIALVMLAMLFRAYRGFVRAPGLSCP